VPIPATLITLLLGMALVLSGLWIGQNVQLLPIDASTNAPIYDDLFRVLFSIGSILFLGVCGLLIFSLVRFRRRPGERGDGMAIEGNLPLEILWTAIPAVVVLFVGLYSYFIYDSMGGMAALNDHGGMQASMAMVADPSPSLTLQASASNADPPSDAGEPRVWGGIAPSQQQADAMPVDVTAMQFAFIFHYPEADITSGELHIPSDRPVSLRMEARDVIHALWIPQFRIKQDVIPGQPTVLTFTATRSWTYPIICAELCGPYHGGMRTNVVVHEPDAYDAWLEQNRPAPAPTVASASANPMA
jgi:cytochrome c oxidase subunit 2